MIAQANGRQRIDPTSMPPDWELIRLGDEVTSISRKNKQGTALPVYSVSNTLGFVPSDEFFDKQVYSRDLTTYKIVERGDFAYNPYRINVGSLGLFDEEDPGLVSPAYVVFHVNHGSMLWPPYLYMLLKSDRWIAEIGRVAMSRGSVRHTLSFSDLAEFLVPAPPLPEQRRIAHVLRTIQDAIAAQERVIAAARELKRSLMVRLFRNGPGREPAETKETEIGEVPAHWEVVRLGNVARIERGKFAHRPRNDPRFYGGGIPFIQTGDVAQCDGRIRTYSQTLNELGLSVSRVFPRGTIVITIAANIGYTGILEFDSAFPDSLIAITPDGSMHSRFLEYYLQTQQPEMDRIAPRGTQKNINIQFLRPWPVPRPPIAEQEGSVKMLQSVDEKIAAEKGRKAGLEALFASMLEGLMTGRLRVKGG